MSLGLNDRYLLFIGCQADDDTGVKKSSKYIIKYYIVQRAGTCHVVKLDVLTLSI